MKIAFFQMTVLEYGGGIEKYFIETVRNLSKLGNIDFNIITMGDEFGRKMSFLFNIYHFKKYSRSNVYKEDINGIKNKIGKAQYRKINTLKQLKHELSSYDVIYSKNEILEAFVLKFLLGYKNLPPIIFGCHTPIYYPITKSIQSKVHNFLYNGFIYKFLASGVNKFHVLNSADKERLNKIFPNKEIVKVCNPFDFRGFVKKANFFKYDYSWSKDKFNILWVARLTEQKGIDDLIMLVNKINKTKHKHKIMWNIVGDGEKKGAIVSLEKKWDNVKYFGHVKSGYVASIYKMNDLFFSTSKWEGFPYNILEAQSFGLPVIAYNIDGCNDIIDNGINGFLIDDLVAFQKKILFFINNGRLTINIAEFIESKFSKDNIYNSLINMFQDYEKK